jgi:enoyl-CoA hydratase/carnithine racemase
MAGIVVETCGKVVTVTIDRPPVNTLTLATYEEMGYAEIAKTLGKSVRAVDSLLFRARRNLRQLLEPARSKGLL